ncbi:phage replisome organizer N-terminal domain-containing protein, partial [Carnobacterium maltaromaticum]
MAEISWIKLSTGLPDNRKIKRIRNLPDGDKVILFWVFLLARAGESNKQGGLYFTETLPYTPEDMAIDFDFTLDVVNFSLITLEKFGMIETYDQVIFIKNWEEYQAVESMEKIREQTRLRVSRHREQKKKLTNGNVTCNADVTESN